MSDEESPKPNPDPEASESAFIQPAEKTAADFIVPGLLGAAGAALLYVSFSKKKTKKKTAKKPSAEASEVKFSKSFTSYTVGKDWEDTVLDPYLAEQAEENNLVTVSLLNATMGNPGFGVLKPILEDSRDSILSAFIATHKVATHEGDSYIDQLPDKSGVREFVEWIRGKIMAFQEAY